MTCPTEYRVDLLGTQEHFAQATIVLLHTIHGVMRGNAYQPNNKVRYAFPSRTDTAIKLRKLEFVGGALAAIFS